ncbi:MAG TPA: hypothetical protein VM409_04820 [Chloroflexia bacterium]|nr:hypothetical protein [Chloroflexia bacterium]
MGRRNDHSQREDRSRLLYLVIGVFSVGIVLAAIAYLLNTPVAPPPSGLSNLPSPQPTIAGTRATDAAGAAKPSPQATVQVTVQATVSAAGQGTQPVVSQGDGQNTKVVMSPIGLSVTLPGTGWYSSAPDDYPDTRSARWYSADRSALFAAFLFDDDAPTVPQLKEFAEEFALEYEVTQPADSRQDTLQRRQAWRIEGVGLGQQDTFSPEYRFVEYWIDKDDGVLIVTAGARAVDWEKGGSEKVKAILYGVTFDR